MKRNPTLRGASAALVHWLFFLNAAIWAVLVVGSLYRAGGRSAAPARAALVIGLLMLANAAAMLGCGILLTRRSTLFYFAALFLLLVNIILTFTDPFSALDLVALLIDLTLLALLMFRRKQFTTR